MSGTLRGNLARRPVARRPYYIGIKATLAPARKPSPPPRQQTAADSPSLPANNVVSIPGSVSARQLSQLSQQPAKATGRVVLERPEELKSTLQHRLWVGCTSALLAGVLGSGLAQVHDLSSAAAAGVAALAAYISADFASAVYHWAVDNYGDGNTPLVGRQIAAFQGHHQRPWTITEREFCNNVHLVFKPALFVAAPLLLAAPHTPLAWNVWASTATLLVCLSQQFHAWSHMKKSELPAAVVALQDAGLLIGRKEHGAHHKAPFVAKYSIVSGWVNPWLDGACPEKSAWRRLELFILARTGVEPRCWYEPDYSWQEQERPTA